tara:strand:- start:47 stop:187 length:141 start_codon:yes stop_codon:yes gene_type:complete
MQTFAQSGSTKTGPFHGSRQRPAHKQGPTYYEEKAGNEHIALLQVG